MAQRVEYILVDDIDQSQADETVRFALDGVSYEIDLSAGNAADLRQGRAQYIGAARRTSSGRRGRSSGGSRAVGGKKVTAAAVRTWALDEGMEVSPRGRIPAAVRDAYDKAHA